MFCCWTKVTSNKAEYYHISCDIFAEPYTCTARENNRTHIHWMYNNVVQLNIAKCVALNSTKTCKEIDIITDLNQSDCRIFMLVGATIVYKSCTNIWCATYLHFSDDFRLLNRVAPNQTSASKIILVISSGPIADSVIFHNTANTTKRHVITWKTFSKSNWGQNRYLCHLVRSQLIMASLTKSLTAPQILFDYETGQNGITDVYFASGDIHH